MCNRKRERSKMTSNRLFELIFLIFASNNNKHFEIVNLNDSTRQKMMMMMMMLMMMMMMMIMATTMMMKNRFIY